MAVKVTFLRMLWWKLKCTGFYKAPPAFLFGFWFVFGAYWALVLIGWVSHLARLFHEWVFFG